MSSRFPLGCLLLAVSVLIWSGIEPSDRLTWWMEVAPVLIVIPILLISRRLFPLTPLLYGCIALHCVILAVGGHYTYAKVPLFDWLRDWLHMQRNSFDGVGHFAQGFVPALAARELLLRTSPLNAGKWMNTLIIASCLGISAVYEIVEWIAAVLLGSDAEAFLGTQGDAWDTQKDMALAGIGAACALLVLPKIHDSMLRRLR